MSSEWYTLFDDDIGRLKFEFWRGMVFLHFKPIARALTVYRRLLGMRDEIGNLLRALGYRTVHVYFRDNAPLERMCSGFGFSLMRRRNGWTAMQVANA